MKPFSFSWKKMLITCALSAFFMAGISYGTFLYLDHTCPLEMPENEKNFAVSVLAEDGSILRVFPDNKGILRYPADMNRVSPLYLKALINYEDRYFWYHPGVNPVSLFRAFFQYIRYQKPVTGGSTLTMQTARILYPHHRTIFGKLTQIFRALQLEYHYTKKEILTIYLNYAPYGGAVEGIMAASYAYLGKSPEELSHAEAALLAVLPQSPSRIRPDRHPARAKRARNKVLDRMAAFGVWERETVELAKMEKVVERFLPRPLKAPLLARRLRFLGKPGKPVHTTINPFLQELIADEARQYAHTLPKGTSVAVLVAENKTLEVKVYVGSADFTDNERFGHVDMIRAGRSPGSALKPFLYGFCMEEGLIHSESLLVDAPLSFSGYRPANFTRHFSGPVSASEALQRSLNIPAVDILDRLGPGFFDARLRQGGIHPVYPRYAGPNLSMILGGVSVTLEELVSGYTALGREGISGSLCYVKGGKPVERRMLTPGAAFIIREILQDCPRPDIYSGRLAIDRGREVAWKTGTSYGNRDAWCIGVTGLHTVGVWVGRPDGTPSPGSYGRATAAPLLFRVVDSLPREHTAEKKLPGSVARKTICWPLGKPPAAGDDPFCHETRTAWVLNEVIPPTMPDRADKTKRENPMQVFVSRDTGLRVEPGCRVFRKECIRIARWPKSSIPWLSPKIRRLNQIPPLDPACRKPVSQKMETITIMGIQNGSVLRPAGLSTRLPTVILDAMGGEQTLYWMLNGEVVAKTRAGISCPYQFSRPGRFHLTVMDTGGNHDSIEILVLGGRTSS